MGKANEQRKAPGNNSSRALKFIFLLGMVSLFADVTYEGARSITGPFLSVLGASATVLGIVTGAAEFTGYGLRLAAGYLADRTEKYWLFTLLGYTVNLLAVPALAFAGRWEWAAVLIILERFGKAIRTPARDTMLSYATTEVGRGWGFAIHEAMDQIGAVCGPLIVAAVLYFQGTYQAGFGILFFPAVLALLTLFAAKIHYPAPRELEVKRERDTEAAGSGQKGKLPPVFWWYTIFTAFTVAGYAHFALISYHLKAQGVVPDARIPVLFAVAMGVDALVALITGKMYDRTGLSLLVSVPLLSLPLPFLVFSGNPSSALAGIILWGAVMGIQETIMRAAIADLTPVTSRGFAYGIFNTTYGLAWFAGSALLGFFYDLSPGYVIGFVIATQLLAIPFLLVAKKNQAPGKAS
ncbi:MAG: MFS transporter [Armatimonadetes bacterium]|nr:MFS transporter [Armatimonadota bacterium]